LAPLDVDLQLFRMDETEREGHQANLERVFDPDLQVAPAEINCNAVRVIREMEHLVKSEPMADPLRGSREHLSHEEPASTWIDSWCLNARTADLFRQIRDWQQQYNPLFPGKGIAARNAGCFLFRDAASAAPQMPISAGRVLSFWLLMLDALQPRFARTEVGPLFSRLRKIAVLQTMCEHGVSPALLKKVFGNFTVKRAFRPHVKKCFADEYDAELLEPN
jgi:hypothetical protein